MMSFFIFTLIICALAGCASGIDEYNAEKNRRLLKNIKEELNDAGIIFNHSLKFTNKDTGEITYFRLYNIEYNDDEHAYYGHCYIFTSQHEIGEWHNEITALLNIANNSYIDDCTVCDSTNIKLIK